MINNKAMNNSKSFVQDSLFGDFSTSDSKVNDSLQLIDDKKALSAYIARHQKLINQSMFSGKRSYVMRSYFDSPECDMMRKMTEMLKSRGFRVGITEMSSRNRIVYRVEVFFS